MAQILNLLLPFFGMILLGFVSGKLSRLPETGLAWLNFFVFYVALPALFFQILSKTPIEELANYSFIAATTFSTYCVFVLAFCIGIYSTWGNIGESTIQGLAGSYSNIGYMGPPLTLGVLGSAAAVPTALIFCFDNILLFTLVPLLMALGGTSGRGFVATLLHIVAQIATNPFIIATAVGVLAAAYGFTPPKIADELLELLKDAAAPCALFSLGVTMAIRKVRRVSGELPLLLAVKLVFHPLLVLVILVWIGDFDLVWLKTAVLMACLPPALNIYVMARQYNAYVERASSILLMGTVASVVTVTAFLYFLTNSVWFPNP